MHAERQFTPQTEALLSCVRQATGTWPTIWVNKESDTMGNRLTQIVTRTGDNGTTGLGNNQRVSKNS